MILEMRSFITHWLKQMGKLYASYVFRYHTDWSSSAWKGAHGFIPEEFYADMQEFLNRMKEIRDKIEKRSGLQNAAL